MCVADNFNHYKNITFKFAAAAATLVTDQVVCAVRQCQCTISTLTRQMPVSVSVSVWQRVSARQIPLEPHALVSSPNAGPQITLAKCPT